MIRFHPVLAALAIASFLVAATAYGQTPTPQPAPASPSIGELLKAKVERTGDKIEAKWKRKKQKLADCRQQSKYHNLHGRKRWKFIAKCVI
jgi:hypothetical protein